MTQKRRSHGAPQALQEHPSQAVALPARDRGSEGTATGPAPRDSPYLLPVYLYVGNVVLEHGGHVDLRELVLAEHNQQTRLSTGTVSHNHQLLPDGRHRCGDKSG